MNKITMKDGWDKIEIITKIISGVLIAGIGVILAVGTSKITKSLETGRLVESLIVELSAPDSSSTLKQDIALITLDHTLFDDNPALVMDICKKVVISKKYNPSTSNTALEIIQKHDNQLYDTLIKNDELKTKLSHIIDKYRDSSLNKDLELAEIKFFEHVFKNVIYIQYRNKDNKQIIENLRSYLNNIGYNAPGVELINRDFGNSIIYFNKLDSTLANTVYSNLKQFIKDNELRLDNVEIKDYSNKGFKVVKGQIEIWLNI